MSIETLASLVLLVLIVACAVWTHKNDIDRAKSEGRREGRNEVFAELMKKDNAKGEGE